MTMPALRSATLRPTERVVAAAAKSAGPGWIYAYLAIQILCQLALLSATFASLRILFRSAAFGTSLLFLLIVPGTRRTHHPARYAVLAVLAVVGLSALNPEGGGALAVAASFAFYLAVIAPMFWVARLRCDEVDMQRLLLALWAFSTASAGVGVLQAMYPGRFQPNIGLLASETGKRQLEGLMIHLSSGAWIPRPLGLTDTPGGAATGGFYAALLGIGVALRRPFPFSRVFAGASIVVGATSLYLCQIRALVVMLGICVITLVSVFAAAGRLSRTAVAAVAAVVFAVVAMNFALSLGGEAVSRRLETLVASDAGTVYAHTRGSFLTDTITELIPEYPLGAGLGRWGMVNQYFGAGKHALWVEIQWTGWCFDGGVALMLAYPVAVLFVGWHSVRLALKKTTPVMEDWSGVMAAYNVGAVALTFSYALFVSTAGIEFWLLNAVLIQAGAARAGNQPMPSS